MIHTQKFIRMRRLVMVLPLLTTPFLVVIFWALGGGKGTVAGTHSTERAGLNPDLPDAHFKNERNAWDKLTLYEQAQRDSIKYREAKRTDPYVRLDPIVGTDDSIPGQGNMNTSLGKKQNSMYDESERARRKIDELYRALDSPPGEGRVSSARTQPFTQPSGVSEDIRNLEMMMEMMQSSHGNDKELQEMQDVLEKILDIQHPERVTERLRQRDNDAAPFRHTITGDLLDPVSILHVGTVGDSTGGGHSQFDVQNGFFGLDDESRLLSESTVPILAVIHGDQTVISGGVVKLRLSQAIVVDGHRIPEGAFLSGTCSIQGERLNISISGIYASDRFIPVSLIVYDQDGIEGIHIPGSISRDVLRQSSDQAVQGLRFSPMHASLELQAAGAGIETAKNLLSKRSRMVKVTVKGGHRVLLVDKNQNKKQ